MNTVRLSRILIESFQSQEQSIREKCEREFPGSELVFDAAVGSFEVRQLGKTLVVYSPDVRLVEREDLDEFEATVPRRSDLDDEEEE